VKIVKGVNVGKRKDMSLESLLDFAWENGKEGVPMQLCTGVSYSKKGGKGGAVVMAPGEGRKLFNGTGKGPLSGKAGASKKKEENS